MQVEFAPAFGALVVEAVVDQASRWTLELLDDAGARLCELPIREATRDGSLAMRVATAQAFVQRNGRAVRGRLLNEAGVLLVAGDVGRRGSGAWLELRTVDLDFGAPIEVMGTFRW